jgi:hypothetical protein
VRGRGGDIVGRGICMREREEREWEREIWREGGGGRERVILSVRGRVEIEGRGGREI